MLYGYITGGHRWLAIAWFYSQRRGHHVVVVVVVVVTFPQSGTAIALFCFLFVPWNILVLSVNEQNVYPFWFAIVVENSLV